MDSQFFNRLWTAADALRGSVSSERYMLFVIGILFLKYISDKYAKAKIKIKAKFPDSWKDCLDEVAILTKYGCSFVVPAKSDWNYVSKYASSQEIGAKLNDAFRYLEKFNDSLQGLFEDQDYNSKSLNQIKLGEVVSLFTNSTFSETNDDFVGRTYEYFLGNFFKKQGQKGGEFYTPKSVVELLVEIIEPHGGEIYDPACGTGGMFIRAKYYMDQKKDKISLTVYGQESLNKVWRLAYINLLIHGFDADDIKLGSPADTFLDDQHKDKTFDFALANPPFNVKNWGQQHLKEDYRFQWAMPPKGNANYAWLLNILTKLKDNGRAGVVLANGSLTSQRKEEKHLRQVFLEKNKIEAIITLPDKLFHTVTIPACLWIFNNAKKTKDVLMVHGTDLKGEMLSKKLRQLTNEEILKIKNVVLRFRSGEEIDEVDFAKSVDLKIIKENDYSFSPGLYINSSEIEEKYSPEQLRAEIKNLAKDIELGFDSLKEIQHKVNKVIKKVTEEN